MAKKKAEGTYEETLNSSEAFFMKYKKPILIALAAIILIIAGIIIYKNFISGPREEKASTELAKSQTLFNTQKYSEALKGFQKIQATTAEPMRETSPTSTWDFAMHTSKSQTGQRHWRTYRNTARRTTRSSARHRRWLSETSTPTTTSMTRR